MNRTNYLLKRLFLMIPVLFVISVGIFLLLKLTPGDTVSSLLPAGQQSEAQIAYVTEKYGLNQPIHVQYYKWLANALQGDLGTSYSMEEPVTTVVLRSAWATAQLGIIAAILGLVVAIPVGLLSAAYRGTWVDEFGRLVSFAGISLPAFWVGIVVILVFSLFWQQWYGQTLVPPGGYVAPSKGLVAWFQHAIAPAATLGIGFAAIMVRQIRSSMIDVLGEEYVRTARAKGVRERIVVLVHAFRNGLVPVVTVLGFQIGVLMNGAVVVEQVFQWPGIGRLLYQAVTAKDVPLVQGIVLFVAVVFVVLNLVVDMMYTYLDPRVEY
ncbi:ABC transporter permease [Halorussus litoreus]|uniref:ABC transporter permease n=1 Tax=Halorussus litoreus TaxID=1710536 RepID=UPI000E246629|nr:ABC transporter permease [Halorussus litoreus]